MRGAAAAIALRRPLAALAPRPHRRRRLLATLGAVVVVACLYLVWFRDSSFVRVEHVSITGLTSADAGRIRQQLTAAARGVTTLHVREGRLEQVAEQYPSVERLEVSPDFPHALRIKVIEFRPVAILVSGRGRVPVAGDGRVLREVRSQGALPEIKLQGPLPSDQLGPGAGLREAAVAGAAPLVLRHRLLDVRETRDRGLVARLRKGPDLIFGDTTRLRLKWLAVARVLADKASRGATYVDLRLPGRPAAGGLAVAPADTAAPTQAAPAAPAATPPQQAAPTTQAPPASAPATPGTTAPGAPTITVPTTPTNP